jgi:hypothetical protein
MYELTLLEIAQYAYDSDKWLNSVHRIEIKTPSATCYAPDIFGAKFDRDTVIQWVEADREKRGQADLGVAAFELFGDLQIKRVHNRCTMKKKVSARWFENSQRAVRRKE